VQRCEVLHHHERHVARRALEGTEEGAQGFKPSGRSADPDDVGLCPCDGAADLFSLPHGSNGAGTPRRITARRRFR
jgi:hypothetical protein